MEPTQELASLSDELALQEMALRAAGVEAEAVVGELVEIDTAALAALEVEIELVAAIVTDVADDLMDPWFVDFDAFVGSQDPAHVAYYEPMSSIPRGHAMRFVLVTCVFLLAVTACIGATI